MIKGLKIGMIGFAGMVIGMGLMMLLGTMTLLTVETIHFVSSGDHMWLDKEFVRGVGRVIMGGGGVWGLIRGLQFGRDVVE